MAASEDHYSRYSATSQPETQQRIENNITIEEF